MKKVIILSAVLVLILGGVIYKLGGSTTKTLGAGVAVIPDTDVTSYQLTVGGAAKSFITSIAGANSANINIKLTASTTASVLSWYNEFSNDTNCDENSTPSNCTWYGEDNTSATSILLTTHSSTTPTHSWTPQTVTSQTKNARIATVSAKWLRTTFSVTGATSSIVVQQAPEFFYGR